MAKENRMSNRFCRTEIMLGADTMERLKNASVAVFGVGGVGGFAAEGIVRSGIGSITLVDDDVVAESNLNRQIIALSFHNWPAKGEPYGSAGAGYKPGRNDRRADYAV